MVEIIESSIFINHVYAVNYQIHAMKHWRTIYTAVSSQDAYVIKAQLELQEIEVLLLDQNSTIYVPNFAAGSGGVRIQVEEHNIDKAIAFLTENKYISNHFQRKSGVIAKMATLSSKIPVLKNWPVEARLITIVAVFALLIIIPYAVFMS